MNDDYEKYNPFVSRMATKVVKPYLRWLSYEEAIQIGWVAFLEAKGRWDGGGCVEGFTSIRIFGAIIDEVRKIGGKKVLGKYQHNGKVLFEDMEPEAVNVILAVDNTMEEGITFHQLLKQLKNPLESIVLEKIFKDELAGVDVGKCIGVSESRASQIKKKGLKNLKQICLRDNISKAA